MLLYSDFNQFATQVAGKDCAIGTEENNVRNAHHAVNFSGCGALLAQNLRIVDSQLLNGVFTVLHPIAHCNAQNIEILIFILTININ